MRTPPRDEVKRAIGARVAQLRHRKELTGVALAGLAGLSHVHLRNIERGYRAPSLAAIERLAQALGVKPSALLRTNRRRRVADESPTSSQATPVSTRPATLSAELAEGENAAGGPATATEAR